MTRAPEVPDTLIIGLGNPLREDDGIGLRVVQDLATRNLPDDVEVMDGGTRGLELVTLLETRRRVIVVDTVEMGREPGEFERFSMAEVRPSGAEKQLSVHSAGLGDALLLAEVLGVLPNELVIFGIQPESLEWGTTLSPKLEQAIPRVVEGILTELAKAAPLP